MNFGREQTENGTLDDMLRQVGINDVGTFVNQFRSKVNEDAGTEKNVNTASGSQQPDLMSMGSSLLNQFGGGSSSKGKSKGSGDLLSGAMGAYKMFSGNKGSSGGEGQSASAGGGGNSADMINSAMNAYKMFSGGKGTGGSGTSGGGSLFDTIGSTFENAQQLQGLLKSLDKNGDGKITIEDIQLLLQGLGLGSVSPHVSKALFKAVDKNGNGVLDLTDVMALAAIVNKLNSRFGSGAKQQA
ncbi:unnamed protein product [Rotaria sordida]|uniref:EF-hand domain-containing protein n=1 Tax=Rotaria sordida TaxID=392033 RepID=A0A814L4T8_9BILA|nr:unnamed protein product [Rotaria sordida]CAF1059466.1 unnamed protein product [Rotaria sordida]